MNLSDIELPSNKKFGFFFTFIFTLIGIYLFYKNINNIAVICSTVAILFLSVTLIRSELLQPLNKIWMSIGLLLGMIVNPLVMGIIFFFIFTPIAFSMRLFGRDELRIRMKSDVSYWRLRLKGEALSGSFKNQF